MYTIWLKRSSPQNIVIGGAAGAFPPLVGWAAMTGGLDLAAVYLFAIVFYWTPPHFWALALIKQADYARAGIPMMPVVRGEARTKYEMLVYTLILLPLTILPSFFGALGPFYGVAAALLGARLLWYCIRLLRERTVTPVAWGMYRYSLLYLALLFVAMGVDRALPFGRPAAPRSSFSTRRRSRSAFRRAGISTIRMTASFTETAKRRLPPPGRLMRLWPRVKPYHGKLVIATLALVASGLLALAFPMAVRYLLDAAFVNRDRELLDRIAIGLVLLFTVQAVLNYVQAYLLSAVGEQAVAGLREELFARLLEMPPGFFAERRTGELTSRLTADIGLLQGVLSHQVSEFSRQILSLVGGVILLTYLQPRLTLTALARGAARGGVRHLLRPPAPDDHHRGPGPPGRGDGRRGGGVLPDPDGAELRPGADRAGPLRRAGGGERPDGAASGPGSAGVFFGMLTLLHLRRHHLRALAGGAPGAGGAAHRRIAGLVPALHHHDRGLHRGAGLAASAPIRRRSVRRSGSSRFSRWTRRSPTRRRRPGW